MYGEGWIFKNGKGGLSGGGGSNGEWIWGDIEGSTPDYTHECEDPLYYLGMLIEEDIGVDYYAFEIFMERKTVPSLGRFSTYGTPKILDYDEDETGTLETEEYTHLPVSEDSYDSGEIYSYSSYTYRTYRSLEIEFDGATYYSPYLCDGQQQYPQDIVLATRGQSYLDSLSGDYEGSIRIWSYAYQRTVIHELEWPGVFIPGIGAGGKGFVGPGLGPLPLPGLLDFINIGLRRK